MQLEPRYDKGVTRYLPTSYQQLLTAAEEEPVEHKRCCEGS